MGMYALGLGKRALPTQRAYRSSLVSLCSLSAGLSSTWMMVTTGNKCTNTVAWVCVGCNDSFCRIGRKRSESSHFISSGNCNLGHHKHWHWSCTELWSGRCFEVFRQPPVHPMRQLLPRELICKPSQSWRAPKALGTYLCERSSCLAYSAALSCISPICNWQTQAATRVMFLNVHAGCSVCQLEWGGSGIGAAVHPIHPCRRICASQEGASFRSCADNWSGW